MVVLRSRCPATSWAMCGGMPCMIASVMNSRRKSWKGVAHRLPGGVFDAERGQRVIEVAAQCGLGDRAVLQPSAPLEQHRRVLADPPTLIVQVRGDPRGAVAAAVRGEQPADFGRELRAPGPPPRGVPVAPLVEPGRADLKRPARGGIRDLMLGPLA